MKILAVGDSFMPTTYFRQAFSELESAHEIRYLQIDATREFVPQTLSEHRLREYQGSPIELIETIADAEILALHGAPVTAEVVASAPALRLVCCARGGPINVDVEAVAARGLQLVKTPGKNAEAVADQTLAFLVMLARGFPKAQRFLDEGRTIRDNWEGIQFMGHDLRGHTLGLVGCGQVGRRVAHRAAAFGLRVLVFDPFVKVDDPQIEQVEKLEELLAAADFVSLHARATQENQKLIGAGALACMKPRSFLVNTARESLVDEDALDDALAAGHLAGAALDVAEPAVDGGRHRLLRHENVVMTPHIGGATHETLLRGAEMIAEAIMRFTGGDDPESRSAVREAMA